MADDATPEDIKVKAAEGRKVRWPNGRPLAEEGEFVSMNDPFWIRRLKDEDIVVVPAEAAPKPKKTEA